MKGEEEKLGQPPDAGDRRSLVRVDPVCSLYPETLDPRDRGALLCRDAPTPFLPRGRGTGSVFKAASGHIVL